MFLVDAAVYPVLAAEYLNTVPGVRDSGGDVWVPLAIMAAMMMVRLAGGSSGCSWWVAACVCLQSLTCCCCRK